MVELSILIVTYNTVELAAHMLERLAEERLQHADGRPLSWEWVLVDNHSPRRDPAGQARLEALCERTRGTLIWHDQNPGYAGGMNLALRHAAGGLILVCNPDMVFERGCVDQLVAALETRPDVGAVGPKGFWDESHQVLLPPNIPPTLGDLVWITLAHGFKAFNRSYARHRTRQAIRVWSSQAPVVLPLLSGCCFLMRRELIERIGFFDERFPLYFEDTDLFRRIARAGQTLLMLPDARLTHFYNRSGATVSEEALRRYWVSRRRYYEKWFGWLGGRLYALCERLQRSAFARRRGATPMSPVLALDAREEAPTLELGRSCDAFVVEIAQDPCFFLAAGILGRGKTWTPSAHFWSLVRGSSYYFRVVDLTAGRCEQLGLWSLTRAATPAQSLPAAQAPGTPSTPASRA